MLEALFSPFKIGRMEVRNRIVMPPMVTFLANESGAVTQRMIDYYAERARGGAGLIIVESAYVLEEDRDFGRLGIENPQLQVGLSELAESICEEGARAFLQLNHRGSVLSIRKGKGPDEMTLEEIERMVEAFSLAARRAQTAGFDGVEIHGANIYLITQFLSPLTNHRKDQYGQGLEGRLKFPTDILLQVRKRVGEDFPVTFRMVANQYTDGGLTLEDGKLIARRMEEAGASALHVIAGSPSVPYWHTPPMAVPRGVHAGLAAEIRKSVRIPVIAVGRINDPLLANEILEKGKADLVAMGRSLIADPHLPRKAQEGRLDEIRRCVACNYCRRRIIELNRTLRCGVNAAAGRERDSRLSPAPLPKKVLVIGGGPGGMEAARVLALRGHRVVLHEKEPKLGGQVKLALVPPHKEELQNVLDYLIPQLQKLQVEVRLQSEVTGRTIRETNPDAVVLAAGGLPMLPEIPGLEREMVFTPAEALEGDANMGNRIIVLGGGMVGCEVAEHLAGKGKRVSLVEILPEIASGMEAYTKRLLLQRLNELSVQIYAGSELVSFHKNTATLRRKGEAIELEADGVVAALGAKANPIAEEWTSGGPPIYLVGDCREVRDIAAAIQEGFRVGMQI